MLPTTVPMHHMAMIGALVVGIIAAILSTGLSRILYAVEDMFEHLPMHWMWWPAIGGVVVGIGGLIFPPALGVGYGVIQKLVTDDTTWKLILGVLVVKSLIWTFSLGSNTSGGILAPLLMIGGAMGAAMGHVLPPISQGAWALVGMSSILAAAIGAPLTAAMLAVELTHNGGLMLPVLLACVVSYAVGVLIQPRSILTERLSRRGFHLSREYGVDPLETAMVRDVMHTSVFALPEAATRRQDRVRSSSPATPPQLAWSSPPAAAISAGRCWGKVEGSSYAWPDDCGRGGVESRRFATDGRHH